MDQLTDEELGAKVRETNLLLSLADNAGENEATAYLDSLRRALEMEVKSRGFA